MLFCNIHKNSFFSKIYLCKIFHLKFLISNENILAPSSKHLTSIAIVELTNDVQIQCISYHNNMGVFIITNTSRSGCSFVVLPIYPMAFPDKNNECSTVIFQFSEPVWHLQTCCYYDLTVICERTAQNICKGVLILLFL